MFRIENWCDEVVKEVRFHPDHKAIRKELTDHYEDRSAGLRQAGYSWDEARERTLAAMGDPAEVGRLLNRVHKPWLGWLWLASRVLLVLFALLALGRAVGGELPKIEMDLTPELVDYESDETPWWGDLTEPYWRRQREDYSWQRLHWERLTGLCWERAGYDVEVPYMGLWTRTDHNGAMDYYLHFALVARDKCLWDGEIESYTVEMRDSAGRLYINQAVIEWNWEAQASYGVFHRHCRMNPFRQVHMFTVPLGVEPGEWVDVEFPDFSFRLSWEGVAE